MEGRTTSQGTACSSDPFFISADAGAPDRRSTGNGRQRNVADMGITPATEEGHMIINGQQEDIATPLSVDELIARKGLNAARHRHGLMPMPASEPHSAPNTARIKRHIPQRKVPS